ncbi:MAG TPA: 23S rRNA (uracil-5-)-methyltransferase RumA, partial [Candidatus Bathyarchaeia archaeon]|nr:23S rRNA (uracil-5-)-methyltransferase RumA [Candidatus Bathyarchaeia archaeon]
FNHIENMRLMEGRMETAGQELFEQFDDPQAVVMVDPPRAGLSDEVVTLLARTKHLANLLYLSCHPENLIRDLKILTAQGWSISRVVPFDFFPKTRHVETLVVLSKENG